MILDGLAHQSLRLGREPLGVDNLALRLLIEHGWPANEVELTAVLPRAALIAEGPTVGVAELEATGFRPDSLPVPSTPSSPPWCGGEPRGAFRVDSGDIPRLLTPGGARG